MKNENNNKNKADERKKELQNKIYQFANELANLTDSAKFNEKFIEFINFQKKFWHYSLNNQILINYQCPNAEKIAGFNQWKKLGRNVKAGSKAIWILAPQLYKNEYDKEEVIFTYSDTGNTEFRNILIIKSNAPYITGFKTVPVFDVSQTEGAELPNIDCKLNSNSRPELLEKYEIMLKKKEITLEYKPMKDSLHGLTNGKKITINSKHSIDDKFQTGIHEYLHFTKHFKAPGKLDKDNGFTKDELEIQAESCSYIISRILGMQSKAYNYIALYNGDGKKILKALNNINKAIKDLIIDLGVTDYANDRMSNQ